MFTQTLLFFGLVVRISTDTRDYWRSSFDETQENKVLEVFPKNVKKEKREAGINQMASAFLSIALDLVEEEEDEKEDEKSENQPLTTPLTISSKNP